MSDSVDRELERMFQLDGNPGPAPPISAARADQMVLNALDAAGFPPPGGGTSTPTGGGGGLAAGKWLAATAVLAGAGVAVYFATRAPDPERLAAPRLETPAAETVADVEPPTEAPPAIVLPEPSFEPDTVDRPDHKARKAEDLLAEANKARGKKKWKDADALYMRVAREFPDSASAQIALVAAGHLRLEHLRQPGKAVKLFQAAARAGGPVGEEADYGLAEAYQATGDEKAEKKALTTFLDRHAGSPLADKARARLKALE